MYTRTGLRLLVGRASAVRLIRRGHTPPPSSLPMDASAVLTSFPHTTSPAVGTKAAAASVAALEARLTALLLPPSPEGAAAREPQGPLIRAQLQRILRGHPRQHPDRWYAQEVVSQLLLSGEKAAALAVWRRTYGLHRTHDGALLLPLQLALYDLVVERVQQAVLDTLLLVELHLRAPETTAAADRRATTAAALLLCRFLQAASFLLAGLRGEEQDAPAWRAAKVEFDRLCEVQKDLRTSPAQQAVLQWMRDVLSTRASLDDFGVPRTPVAAPGRPLLSGCESVAARRRLYAALLRHLFAALELPPPLLLDAPVAGKRQATAAAGEDVLRLVHAAMDKGDWAAALRALAHARLPPLRTARKALRACELAVPRGAGWSGALAVWGGAAGRHLGRKEVGRVFHLLAQAHRWDACLSLLQAVPGALQDEVVLSETAYALRTAHGHADLVLELWAAWRCQAGDSAPPSPRLTAHVLQAGLYGSETTAAAACVLLRGAAQQRADRGRPTSPGATLPLDFVREEEAITRLLRDRWRTESWQAALEVALAHPTSGLLATVAQESPLRYAVYEATSEAARAHGLALPAAQRHALARHYATARHSSEEERKGPAGHHSRATGSPTRPRKGAAREVELVTRILDDMLGRE